VGWRNNGGGEKEEMVGIDRKKIREVGDEARSL
jgi:hypothetical protein